MNSTPRDTGQPPSLNTSNPPASTFLVHNRFVTILPPARLGEKKLVVPPMMFIEVKYVLHERPVLIMSYANVLCHGSRRCQEKK